MSEGVQKRPPTRGTRKGNGAGWGGPARGASAAPASIQTAPEFSAENQPTSEAKAEGQQKRILDLEDIKAFYSEVVLNQGEATPNRISAAAHLADRIAGKPPQAVINTETNDAPGVMERLLKGRERAAKRE